MFGCFTGVGLVGGFLPLPLGPKFPPANAVASDPNSFLWKLFLQLAINALSSEGPRTMFMGTFAFS